MTDLCFTDNGLTRLSGLLAEIPITSLAFRTNRLWIECERLLAYLIDTNGGWMECDHCEYLNTGIVKAGN